MNYLAHLYLAAPQGPPADAEFLVGNLLGDFFKGRLDGDNLGLSRRRLAGVRLHRAVDSYTDAHPLFRRSKRRLRQPLRRYGGIVIDLFYDHFLACRWAEYCAVPLAEFSRSVYVDLQNHYHSLPVAMQRSVSYMQRTDLLQSYQSLDGVGRALAGIEKKLKRPSPLRQACADLKDDYSGFGEDFAAFFPDLIAYAERHQATPTGQKVNAPTRPANRLSS